MYVAKKHFSRSERRIGRLWRAIEAQNGVHDAQKELCCFWAGEITPLVP